MEKQIRMDWCKLFHDLSIPLFSLSVFITTLGVPLQNKPVLNCWSGVSSLLSKLIKYSIAPQYGSALEDNFMSLSPSVASTWGKKEWLPDGL